MNDHALQDFFDFDESDLAANRNGEFSAKQKQKITSEYQENTNDGLRLGVPTAALAFILLLVNIIFFKKLGSDAITTIIFMLICAGLGYYGLRNAYNTRKIDFSRFPVEKVTGPVRIEQANFTNSFIHIGEQQFEIDQQLASSLKDGDSYTFFINSRDGGVLSVEGISKD
jgi:hypothetical protein